MEGFLLAQSSPGILLVGAAMFVILFTVILTALRRARILPSPASVILAICASLLAVIGIVRTFSVPASPPSAQRTERWFDLILLPYAAMGVAMLLVLLLFRLAFPRKKASGGIMPALPDVRAGCNTHDAEDERHRVASRWEDRRSDTPNRASARWVRTRR